MEGPFESEEVARAIREEYRRMARRKLIGTVVVMGVAALGTLVMILGAVTGWFVFKNGWMYTSVFGGMMLLALCFSIFQTINWRCPRCRAQFRSLRNPRYCFNCGVRLRE